MDTHFQVILENQCAEAAKEYLRCSYYVDGEMSSSERGKRRDKEEYEPKMKEAKERLVELLKLNYPEFEGRFLNVNYYVTKEHAYVTINRLTVETQPAPATATGDDMWSE